MRITKKLGILVAVPLIAVVAFAALAVATSGSETLRAERLRGLVETSKAAGDLMQQLRSERSSALLALSAGSGQDDMNDFSQDTDNTDRAIRTFHNVSAELTSVPKSTSEQLNEVDSRLELLGSMRRTVQSQDQNTSSAAFVYRILIADLQSWRESVSQAGGVSAAVTDHLRAASALSQAAEDVGLLEVAGLRAESRGELSAASQQAITSAHTSYAESIETFKALAKNNWVRWVEEEAESTGKFMEAQRLEQEVSRMLPGDSVDIDQKRWASLMDSWSDLLLEQGSRVDADINKDVTELRNEQSWWTWMETLAVTLSVFAAIALAVWLGRPVVKGLGYLRDSARRVATTDLPEAVARFDDHEVLGELSPDEFADSIEPPVKVAGKDELAEVGRAFNDVHREAVRVAAAQALLRLHIGSIFLNLARRGHALSGQLTAEIDAAESRELDPERLERLFKLDHLVTLLARSNDSLLVLGGASPAKVRSADEPLREVLTAAQSQIELYTRVDVGEVATGLAVRAAVVDDVVKLLAELMDNATRYSQPQVRVEANPLEDRMVIRIIDEGIGMDASQMDTINARLVNKPPLDLEAVRAMGLTVVGHIASQLGVLVQLRLGQPRGVVAEVTLPSALLTAEPRRSPRPYSRGSVKSHTPRLFRDPSLDDDEPESGHADEAGTAPAAEFSLHSATPHSESEPPEGRSGNLFDDGWRTAEAASETPVDDDSEGLPQRSPGARLVPGGTVSEDGMTPRTEEFRDPASVGATYAAYARGRPTAVPSSRTEDDRRKPPNE